MAWAVFSLGFGKIRLSRVCNYQDQNQQGPKLLGLCKYTFLTPGGNFIFSVFTELQDTSSYEKVQASHIYLKGSCRSQMVLLPENWCVSISLFQFIISVLRGWGFLTTSHCMMFHWVCAMLNERGLGNDSWPFGQVAHSGSHPHSLGAALFKADCQFHTL